MKIPKGWWKVESGHYRIRRMGIAVRYRRQINKVSENNYKGWYVESVILGNHLGPFPTARAAFAALGVEVERNEP